MQHLDTNIVIAYLNGHRGVADEIKRRGGDLAISTIVLAELFYGAWNSAKRDKNLHAIDDFVGLIRVIPFDSVCANIYGRVRAQLCKIGLQRPELDLLIAATALAREATLVTNNTKDFKHIPGLKLENWIA